MPEINKNSLKSVNKWKSKTVQLQWVIYTQTPHSGTKSFNLFQKSVSDDATVPIEIETQFFHLDSQLDTNL